MYTEDKNYIKLLNLLRFNINLSNFIDVGPLLRQSPDYILEKYNHWIGIEPVTDYPNYTPDSCQLFIDSYHKIWGNHADYQLIRRQLLYLNQTENLNLLNIVNTFEEYFGPVSMISSQEKRGLHQVVEQDFMPKVLLKNTDNIKVILRDMRLKEINL